MADGKIGKFTGGRHIKFIDAADVIAHPLFYGVHNALHFVDRSFQNQFHLAITKIFDVAGDVVPHGDVSSRVPETYPLNLAAEEIATTKQRRRFNCRLEHRVK